jgi:hypothetical protein
VVVDTTDREQVLRSDRAEDEIDTGRFRGAEVPSGKPACLGSNDSILRAAVRLNAMRLAPSAGLG